MPAGFDTDFAHFCGSFHVGPYSYVGRRRDDPNDRVSHEDRRDLRGYAVVSAWINNVDTIEANILDAYVGEPGRGHVVHYQQDVGGSFGNYAVGPLASWMSYESYFDFERVLASRPSTSTRRAGRRCGAAPLSREPRRATCTGASSACSRSRRTSCAPRSGWVAIARRSSSASSRCCGSAARSSRAPTCPGSRDGYHVVTLRVRRVGDKRFGPKLRVHWVQHGATRRVVGLDR